VNPGNAPGSQSGTWYTGSFTIEAGDDGDSSADDTIYWVLTDNVTSGVYNILNLSYDSSSFNDGDTGDQVVGSGDDEGVNDGEDVTIGTYRFTVNFDSDPATASPDAWLTSSEWYTGTFNIDVNGDGTIGGSEYVNYTLSDSDSDGMYDTMDISVDDDVYGEGTPNNNLVTSDDDEWMGIAGADITLGTYLFNVTFYENPNTADPDSEIQSKEWYEGAFTIDADDDGTADDTIYFVLSDSDSDGVYDIMDLSLDTTYQEGALNDDSVTTGNDEEITASDFLTLGNSLQFEVEFDSSPTTDTDDARIKSNEWYEGTFTIDGNGDGAVEIANVYYVLTDRDSDGIYDTMDISMGDQDYGETDLSNQIVDFSTSDNSDDENLTSQTDITLGDHFLFTVAFEGAPNQGTNDANITSKEWYEGSFLIDAEGDGIADDTVNYVLTDDDSDGLYDVMDISIGDTDYGEGTLDDNVVDFDSVDNTDDEQITTSTNVTLGNYYLFTVEFDDAPHVDGDDAKITCVEWYEGTFTMDADDDGVADDTIYYVLSDFNSDGVYDRMDISFDTTYGEGNLVEGNVTVSDDERITAIENLTLGQSLEFEVGFDGAPNMDADDARITSNEWYEGTFTIDGNGDGTVETDNVNYVLSDTDSDGVYDTMEISMGDSDYGEGNAGDFVVDFSTSDNSNDEQITSQTNITLGLYFLFSVDFDGAPNQDAVDANITSVQWYEGTFTIDADGDGTSDDNVNYVLTDTDSDGLYEVMDISIGDTDYGEGAPNDNVVDFDVADNTNDEQISVPTNVTLGNYYRFTIEFDVDPNVDDNDARITCNEWYEGSFTLDADDGGVADDTVFYVLSDSDSDGIYETMDISADTTYGEGNLVEGNVTASDDERITATENLTLGTSLEFETSFDGTPNSDLEDARIKSNEWYEGTFTIDGNGDGVVEANNVHYVLSDTDSDGIYDTMDISIGDEDYGEDDLGNFIVDFSSSDNSDDENLTAQTNITLGDYFLFTVDFDGAPNQGAIDANITSNEWYVGTFTIDAEGDGIADDTIHYVLTDSDSDGLYDTMDISCTDQFYGEGDVNDDLVDFDASDNTNDEQINSSTNITLGNYYLFTVGFDDEPNLDANDTQITNNEWYEGSFTVDANDDGVASETALFVLTDSDSDGIYDTMDISADSTYG
jgi:hypothetical protein